MNLTPSQSDRATERKRSRTRRSRTAVIDLARDEHLVCCQPLAGGEPIVWNFGTTTDAWEQLAARLKEEDIEAVAMEGPPEARNPLGDWLQSLGFNVSWVQASQPRLVRGCKTESQDCWWMQQLASRGLQHSTNQQTGPGTWWKRYIHDKEKVPRWAVSPHDRFRYVSRFVGSLLGFVLPVAAIWRWIVAPNLDHVDDPVGFWVVALALGAATFHGILRVADQEYRSWGSYIGAGISYTAALFGVLRLVNVPIN